MKTLHVFFIACSITASQGVYAQAGNTIEKDSVQRSAEREMLYRALVNVRDSINETLAAIEEKRAIAAPKSKRFISRAAKELQTQKAHAERSMNGINAAQQSGAAAPDFLRIKSDLGTIRSTYKRIRLDLAPHLSVVKS
jgi:hypothetical protein